MGHLFACTHRKIIVGLVGTCGYRQRVGRCTMPTKDRHLEMIQAKPFRAQGPQSVAANKKCSSRIAVTNS
jgi:hypothetical protein